MKRIAFFLIAISLSACQRSTNLSSVDPVIEDAQGNYLDVSCLQEHSEEIQAGGRGVALNCAVGSKGRGFNTTHKWIGTRTYTDSFSLPELFPPTTSSSATGILRYHNYSCKSIFKKWYAADSLQDSCYTSIFGYPQQQYGSPYYYSGYQSPWIRRWVKQLLRPYYLDYCQQNPSGYGCNFYGEIQKPKPTWPWYPYPTPQPDGKNCYDAVHNGSQVCTMALVSGYKVDRATGSCVQAYASNGCYTLPFNDLTSCQAALASDQCGSMAQEKEDCSSPRTIYTLVACWSNQVRDGYQVIGNACIPQRTYRCNQAPRFDTYAECEAKRASGICAMVVY